MKTAEAYIAGKPEWQEGLNTLRNLILELPFEEHIKWNAPVYMACGRNLVGLSAFKNHFGLWFFEGASLSDRHQVLTNAQEGKTKYMRQWKFNDVHALDSTLIRTYLKEVLEVAQNTKAPEQKSRIPAKNAGLPSILEEALKQDPLLLKAFENFTPYKRKEFSAYIGEAKRESTQRKRLEKILPMIRKGEGLNDKYR